VHQKEYKHGSRTLWRSASSFTPCSDGHLGGRSRSERRLEIPSWRFPRTHQSILESDGSCITSLQGHGQPDFLQKGLSVDDPPVIPLPEDDPVAMYWVSTVLHHREWTHGSLPTPIIKGIAILCDKYDCAVALKPWSAMFLLMLQSDLGGLLGASNWQTIWMSHAFDDHDAFTQSTSSLVWQAAREFRPDPIDLLFQDEQDSVGLSILPDRLWGESLTSPSVIPKFGIVS